MNDGTSLRYVVANTEAKFAAAGELLRVAIIPVADIEVIRVGSHDGAAVGDKLSITSITLSRDIHAEANGSITTASYWSSILFERSISPSHLETANSTMLLCYMDIAVPRQSTAIA